MYTRPPTNDSMMLRTGIPDLPERRPNWWLRLTSMPATRGDTGFASRERVRRSRLASWLILGMIFVLLLIVPLAVGSEGTSIALAAVSVGTVIATICNRAGWVTTGAVVLIVMLTGGIFGSIVSEPNGLTMFDMPGYDSLAITVVVATSILPAVSGFIVAAIDAVLIVLNFALQPHAADVATNIQLYGSVALLARPIALLLIVAVVAYLWVLGTHRESRRANRAEEVAVLEHAYAEQRRQLEIGVQQILATHVRIANGDFRARAPMTQDNVLWQVAASLNNLVVRLQSSMAQATQTGRAAYQLQRTEDEALRLAEALRNLQAGRQPIWPQQTGTVIDQLIAIVRPNRLAAPPPGSSWGMPAQGGRSSFSPGPQSQSGISASDNPAWFSNLPSNSSRWQDPNPSSQSDPDRGYMPDPPPQRQSYSEPYLGGSTGEPARPAGAYGERWPSLEPNDRQIQEGRADGTSAGQQSDQFPPLDNPWYLPPDE
jgi:hypothetical protein